MSGKDTAKKIKIFVKWALLFSLFFFLLFLLLNRLFPLPDGVEYSTVITDRKGEVLHVSLTRDEQWRMKTGLSDLSPLLKRTIVAKEDKYFYEHPGINPIAIGRALLMNILHMRRTSGASTITMQVARALEPRHRTYAAKCIEAFRALQLEWKYPKDQILQLYVNLLPYGGNIQGVQDRRSTLFFNKDPDHLSLAEITALAVIPNRPQLPGHGPGATTASWQNGTAGCCVSPRKGSLPPKRYGDALAEPLTATRGAKCPRMSPTWPDG